MEQARPRRNPQQRWVAPFAQFGAICFRGRPSSVYAWAVYCKPLKCYLARGTAKEAYPLKRHARDAKARLAEKSYIEPDDLVIVYTRLMPYVDFMKEIDPKLYKPTYRAISTRMRVTPDELKRKK